MTNDKSDTAIARIAGLEEPENIAIKKPQPDKDVIADSKEEKYLRPVFLDPRYSEDNCDYLGEADAHNYF
jgi:hypothetical protein